MLAVERDIKSQNMNFALVGRRGRAIIGRGICMDKYGTQCGHKFVCISMYVICDP